MNAVERIGFAQILSNFAIFTTVQRRFLPHCCFSFSFSSQGRFVQLFINKFGLTFPLRRIFRKVSFATSFDHRSGPAGANVVVGLGLVNLV